MMETEMSFPVNGFSGLQKKLKSLHAKKVFSGMERNVLFDFADARLKKSDSLVRLRREGKDCRLCFKGPAKKSRFKVRKEIEFEVSSFDLAADFLGSLGLKESFRYEKKKQVFECGGVCVVLLELPLLGKWVEVEGAPSRITKTVSRLGLNMASGVNRSFIHLFAEYRKKNGLKQRDMVW
ncbi:MAG: class IV adenylate cyclase [Candidatus Diapherotrites archaeon]|nr:class IV adenylate cyclase [Candidatus Diapherotrites archaeon]